jgi:D-methionine transport system ATP-binding protein
MDVIKQICNKVAVIEGGSIIEQGSTVEVFGNPQKDLTKQFLQSSSHNIPAHFFETLSDRRALLRLKFKGSSTNEPVISLMIKKCDVDANFLMGWIDQIESAMVGMMVVELTGSAGNIEAAKEFLKDRGIQFEVLKK